MPKTHIPNLLFDLSCRISYPYGISTPYTPYATLPAIPTPPPTRSLLLGSRGIFTDYSPISMCIIFAGSDELGG